MADFEVRGCEEGWLLTPTSRASRAWCQSNLANEVRKSGDGYVVEEHLMLQIIEEYMDSKTKWFGF